MKKHKRDKSENSELIALKNSLARALADYDNLTKRVNRDKSEYDNKVKAQIVSQLLPSFDMLIDAGKHLNNPGLALALKELEDSLKMLGVVRIPAQVGGDFNENLHEAIDIEKGDKKGKIAKVESTGWQITNGPIIRYAKVKVYK